MVLEHYTFIPLDIDIFSRNGKELNNFDHLKNEIIKYLDFTSLKNL